MLRHPMASHLQSEVAGCSHTSLRAAKRRLACVPGGMAGRKGSLRRTTRTACRNGLAGWPIRAFRGTKRYSRSQPRHWTNTWEESNSYRSLAPNCGKCPSISIFRPNHRDHEMLPDFICLLHDVPDLAELEARLERMNQSDEP